MTKNKILEISIVGCGRISKNHISSLEKLKNKFLIKSVCDIDINKMNEIDLNNDMKYENFYELVDNTSSDLYVLCTPSGVHPKQIKYLLNANRNVLSEKPIATNLDDGRSILNSINKSKARFFTVKQNRFNKTIIKLKDLLQKNSLGKIFNINVNVFWTRPQSYYDQAEWRGTKELDGGAFLNQASHYFDLIIYLFGSVKCISAYTKTAKRHIEMEDSGISIIELDSGSLCTLNVTMLTYGSNYEGSITIIGENGTIKLGGKALNQFEFCNIDSFDCNLENFNYEIESIYGHGHMNLYNSLYNSLISGSQHMLEGNAGYSSLELIMAAYESSISKKTIFLKDFKKNG